MSVLIKSVGGKTAEGIANGNFAAMIACARACDKSVPAWTGFHDCGTVWTPEQCRIIAGRIEQISQFSSVLREVADDGGMTIS